MTAPPPGYSQQGGSSGLYGYDPLGSAYGGWNNVNPTSQGNGGQGWIAPPPPQQPQYPIPGGRTTERGWEWDDPNQRTFTDPAPGMGWPQQPGGTPGGPGSGGQPPGGGHYGGPGTGGTTPPGQSPTNGPLYTKSDTDRAVSQAAANAFGQADPYSLRVASSGNGLSYGANQASQINPILAQSGVQARTAAKTIPMQDALANEAWGLGNQTNRARDALSAAQLDEYRRQTGMMDDTFFYNLLSQMLGSL